MTTTLEPAAPATAEDPAHPGPPVTVRALRRQLGAAVRVLLVLTVLLGVAYPAGVWAVSRLPGLHAHAEGSVTPGGGSSLVGLDPVAADPAADPWFHTRPSTSATGAAGLGPADPTTSGGSNLAAGNDDLRAAVGQRRAMVAAREGVAPGAVPPDAVTASGSGLDPHVSPAYAELQVPRVARVTGLGEPRVRALVARATEGRSLGFLGEPRVNVTVLDELVRAAAPGAR